MPERVDECQTRPWPVIIALGLLLLSLIALQYRTLSRFINLKMSYARFDIFWFDVKRLIEPGWEDALWITLPVAAFAFLILLEVRRKQISLLLEQTFCSDRATWFLLVVSTLVLIRYYFAAGEIGWAGDASAHLAYAYAAARSIVSGEWPIWSNFIGVGSPYLQYYGFLFFYLTGLLNLLCGDFILALKLCMALGHLVSAAGMFMLVRSVCRSRAAGYLSALAYVLCFWHVQQVLLMGRFPLSLFYALLPFPFYFFEQFRLRRRRRSALVGGALTLGMLPLVHPGYGFWGTLFFCIYAGLRLLLIPRLRSTTVARYTVLMLCAAALFGAYLTVPMWLERTGTGIAEGISLANVPDPPLKRLFLWSNLLFPAPFVDLEGTNWYGGYLGNSLVALALVGLALPFRMPSVRRYAPHLSAGICFLMTLLLVLGYRWSVLQALPIVTAMSAGRYLLFTVFFMSLLVGVAGSALRSWRGRSIRWKTLSLPILIVLVDLAPTTLLQPYVANRGELYPYSREVLRGLRTDEGADDYQDGELSGTRLFTTLGSMHPFLVSTWLLYRTALPTPQAEHRLILPSMLAFVAPFERYLDQAMHHIDDPEMQTVQKRAEVLRAGLRLLNVKYFLAVYEGKRVYPFVYTTHTPILVSPKIASHPILERIVPSEQLISQSLATVSPEERQEMLEHLFPVTALIEKMEVHIDSNRCERILIPAIKGEHDLGTQPDVEIMSHRVWNQRVELLVRTSAACYARLAYAYFPFLDVRVNGILVNPMETAGGFLALQLQKGFSRITIEAKLSNLRRGLLCLDAVLLCLGIGVLVRERRKHKKVSQ